jgi:hypothetical protein
MPLCTPIYDPAHAITGRATGAAVTGCRIATQAATKPDGEPTPIKHCGATDQPLGAIADDTAQNDTVAVYKNGFACPVLAGGTGVTFGKAVEVMATGVIQDLASGTRCGLALETGAAGTFPKIILQV